LLIKYHIIQPQLPATPNGDNASDDFKNLVDSGVTDVKFIWSISTMANPAFLELVKFGVRSNAGAARINAVYPGTTQAGNFIAMPWMPMDSLLAIGGFPPSKEVVELRRGDYGDSHFKLASSAGVDMVPVPNL